VGAGGAAAFFAGVAPELHGLVARVEFEDRRRAANLVAVVAGAGVGAPVLIFGVWSVCVFSGVMDGLD
jgi:hypothetical protein